MRPTGERYRVKVKLIALKALKTKYQVTTLLLQGRNNAEHILILLDPPHLVEMMILQTDSNKMMSKSTEDCGLS